jgi:LacI family transcriptional regulator
MPARAAPQFLETFSCALPLLCVAYEKRYDTHRYAAIPSDYFALRHSRVSNAMSVPTVIDVAKLAGVSVSTVSRILNGNTRVAKDKQALVEGAISQLNFQPNLSARSLRGGSSKLIGVLTQELQSPYFTAGTIGIEDGLANTGYAPVLMPTHWNAEQEIERARLLLARRVDALIILGGNLRDEQVIELAKKIPVAVTDRKLIAPNIQSFYFDQIEGGRMAVNHLIELGHRRIAHIAGPPTQSDSIERREGYFRAHRDARLSIDPNLLIDGDFMEPGGMRAMTELLARTSNFTAVFCANDQTLIGARLALYRHKLRVPEDISLVGFDDVPQLMYLTPPATTIRQPTQEMGFAAARAVLRALGADVEAKAHPPLSLVVRETTRQLN